MDPAGRIRVLSDKPRYVDLFKEIFLYAALGSDRTELTKDLANLRYLLFIQEVLMLA